MKTLLKIISIVILFLFIGCKSAKNVKDTGELNSKLSTKQIIKEHDKRKTKFKTLQSRVRVEYTQKNQSQTHSFNLRMEKDKTIWLSATLGIVRVKITPTNVSFYNKLDNTYFDGDFSLLSDLLGTELDFNKLQNMLLGQALFNLGNGNYNAEVHEKSYMLHPKRQNDLLEIFLLLNPTHFKMDSQQISQMLKRRMLQINYKNYQEISNQILPQDIKIIAVEDDFETIISMEFKSVTLDSDLRFPFRIPSGFEEIVIK